MKKLFNYFTLLILFFLFTSTPSYSETESTSEINSSTKAFYPFEIGKNWGYIGALQMDGLLGLNNISLGYHHWNKFFKKKYNMDHDYKIKMFEPPADKVKNGKEGRFFDYKVRLSTDEIAKGLSFFTQLDFLREKWGSSKGINFQHRYSILGAEYAFHLFTTVPYIKFSYVPIYEFINYSQVDGSDNKIDDHSREYLHHAFSLEVGTVISNKFSTKHTLSYHIVKDIKLGDPSADANEISSDHSLFYMLNENFYIYYSGEYLQRNIREKLMGFKKTQFDQSMNLLYKF